MFKTQTIAVIADKASKWNGYRAMIDKICDETLSCDVTILEPIEGPQGWGCQLGDSISVDFNSLTSILKSKTK